MAMSLSATLAYAQTPQPFPRPNPTTPQKPPQPPPAPTPAPEAPKAPQVPTQSAKDGVPTEAILGAPIYPSAVYLTSYDAGRGQRFYIFGVTVPYVDMVNFYRTVLKTKGDELFEAPPTHQFETVRFRDESMAFPPSVTIKDFTYGGSAGYPNPKKGATPERFPTIIQIAAPPR
ncbi:MAG TPA: hypothetical protein VFZ38_20225 [Vicinamibacterales bacterium]